MISIADVATVIKAACGYALPGREAVAVNDIMRRIHQRETFAYRLRGDRRQRRFRQSENRRRPRRSGYAPLVLSG